MDFGFFIMGVMLLIVGAFILMTAYLMERASRAGGESRVRGGGVVIVGPVPIIFGSDKGMAVVAAVIGAALTIIALITWLVMVKGW